MTRLFWTTLVFALAVGALAAQSTWRGQAELWQGTSVPTTASAAASNDFPRNSIVTIENYKTKKVVQVRIVSALPSGSSAFVLVTPKVASDLGMVTGETPLVGVQVDTSVAGSKGLASDDAINPDRDVNPVATVAAAGAKTVTPVAKTVTPVAPAPAPAEVKTVPKAVSSPTPPVPAPTPTPEPVVVKPQATASLARTGASTNPLDLTRSTTALDPDLVPLPTLEAPPAVAPPTVAVRDAEDDSAPVTPGRRVFLPVAGTETVASEVPAAEEVAPIVAPTTPVAEASPIPEPTLSSELPPISEATPDSDPATVTEPTPLAEPSPLAEPTPLAEVSPVEATPTTIVEQPAAKPAAVAESAPVVDTKPAPSVPTTVSVVLPPPAAATSWVSVPAGLSGPVLGQVGLLTSLQKGKSYVQVAAFANVQDVQKALDSIKSYVPVSIYQASGEKNPWRIVIDSAPKAQIGLLMMSFRAQGYRGATIVKG